MKEERTNQMRRLVERYLEGRKAAGMRDTGNERLRMEYFLEFMGEREEDITRVTGETLHQYQLRLYNKPGKRVASLSLATQMNCLVGVRQFFRWLVKRGHILADPSTGLELPRQKQLLPRVVMTGREVRRLLKEPDVDRRLGLRDRAMMELLYSTGLRNAELRELKIYDVDLEEGEALVREGKGGKDRVVPVGEVAGSFVRQYLGEERSLLVKGKEDPGYLFLSGTGNPLDSSAVRRVVEKYVALAGIKKRVTPHTFRHTCATHMLKGRADIRHIQALLGHGSLDTTQIYTRVEVGDLKRELRRCHPRERGV